MKSVCIKIVNSRLWLLLLSSFNIAKIPLLQSFSVLSDVMIIPRFIAFWTKISNTVSTFLMTLFTSLKFFCRMVSSSMTASIGYNKVFWFVVIFYSIYVVNDFCGFEKSAQCYFHNKTTSLNIWVVSFLVSITGMIGIIYENIASLFDYSTLPITHNDIITQFERRSK